MLILFSIVDLVHSNVNRDNKTNASIESNILGLILSNRFTVRIIKSIKENKLRNVWDSVIVRIIKPSKVSKL